MAVLRHSDEEHIVKFKKLVNSMTTFELEKRPTANEVWANVYNLNKIKVCLKQTRVSF